MYKSTTYPVLAAFLVFSSFCSLAGWLLSAAHGLNGMGYLLAAGLFLVSWGIAWARKGRPWPDGLGRGFLPRVRRMVRRPLPLCFLAICVLILISGAAYVMDFQDALAYRLPRVYAWLAAGQWHWLATVDQRMNSRGTVFEWMSVPLILLTHSERLGFLINFIPFVLLPALLFDTYVLLGVARKVAWFWMWAAPAGLTFVLQAQTCANDLLAGFYALAAVNLALNASRFQRPDALALALLAFALATGVKVTSLFLVLPVGLALVPALPLARRWSPLFLGALLAALFFSSLLPNAFFNDRACGDWTGVKLDLWAPPLPSSWWLKLPCNALLFAVQNFAPPFWPFAARIDTMEAHLLQTPWGLFLTHRFEIQPLAYAFPPVDAAAVGPLLSLLVALGVVVAIVKDGPRGLFGIRIDFPWFLRAAAGVSLLAFFCVSNLYQVGRIGSTFDLLALPFFIVSPVQRALVGGRFWRTVATGNSILVVFILLFSPLRPAFPVGVGLAAAKTILGPDSRAYHGLATVYSNGMKRITAARWLSQVIPADARRVGIVRDWYQMESPLWHPFPRREVLSVGRGQTPASLRAAGIRYLVLTTSGLRDESDFPSPADWCRQYGAHEIAHRIAHDGDLWTVVALDPLPGMPP